MGMYELFFNKIAENLDLTETEFNAIKNSYNALGGYLASSRYLANYEVDVFPQGSVRLGTVIKPLKRDDYDIDLVCKFTKNEQDLSPKEVKHLVGTALKFSNYFSQLEEEHGRCWTLNYNGNPPYHIDILPGKSINNSERVSATIKKDNNNYEWLYTNPRGFAEWFQNVSNKRLMLDESRQIEPVKQYNDKSPLQRAIQLVKRHRDVFYSDNPDDGPASVIITALMGLSYNGESTIEEILKNNPLAWASHIKIIDGKYSIKIPTLPDDDYADKWNGEDPGAAKRFFEWHARLLLDLDLLFSQIKIEGFLACASKMFHQSSIDKIRTKNNSVIDSLNESFRSQAHLPIRIVDSHPLFSHASSISSSGHSFIPRENLRISISCSAYSSQEDRLNGNNSLCSFASSSPLLEKGIYLKFEATIVNAPSRYYILWQITNTGKEALNCLRGGFEKSDFKKIKCEETSYSGTHFVQAFLIDSNSDNCVAKSNIIAVNIGATI